MKPVQGTVRAVTVRRVRRAKIPILPAGTQLGLGEPVARLASAVGIRPCDGCVRPAAALNDRMVFISGHRSRSCAAGPPAPKPGCWFTGTNCYGFIQTLKFCCGDGTDYTVRWGWCIGFWTAPPCRPGGIGGA
jgi:hypothetical protein